MGRIAGKITVVTKLLYYFRTLPKAAPLEAIRKFQARIFNFIWGTEGSRLACTVMYAPKDLGGLEALDIC